MKSMTGYAYVERNFENCVIMAEIRGVNSRFLDISVNLPDFLLSLEGEIHKKIKQFVHRGKVDVKIYLKKQKKDFSLSLSPEALSSYCNAINEAAALIKNSLSPEFETQKLNYTQILAFILRQDGVLSAEKKETTEDKEKILAVTDEALTSFVKEKEREGKRLWQDISKNAARLQEAVKVFAEWRPKMEAHFKEIITKRFQEVAGEFTDTSHILNEVASLLVRYTINEEAVRLSSHLEALEKLLKEEGSVGRRLDFLSQEINRELVTIGSKSQMEELSSAVLCAKVALENIREQVRNVE